MMKIDADGKPRIGTSFGMLGVRPPGRGAGLIADINVDENGNVHPGSEGMSTFDHLLPLDKKHLNWVIESDDIGQELSIVPSLDTAGRYHVVPGRVMSLAEYQLALANTQDLWDVA